MKILSGNLTPVTKLPRLKCLVPKLPKDNISLGERKRVALKYFIRLRRLSVLFESDL